MAPLRGVILDVDGTLVDSNDAHALAWVEALAEHGHAVPFERVRPLIGMGSDKLLPEVTGIEVESDEGRRITESRKELFQRRHVPGLRAFPGVRPLLRRMRQQGLQLVVASSATEQDLRVLLEIAGADDLIEERTSSDDAERSKPDPDVVRAALRRSGLEAGDVVMLGDTPYDVEAAGRAGVGVIAVRCGGWSDENLRGALAVYADPAELLARYDASPLGDRAHA
ncbi:MAG: HAD family hydrolase [Gemmatimonadota bacterium]